jgi:hypothetical protein
MKWWKAAFLVFFMAVSSIAQTPDAAQTPTASATPGVALVPTTIPLFPQAVYFELAVPLPAAEVTRTSLTVSFAGSEPVTVVFPQQVAYSFADEFVVAITTLAVPAQPPPLFSTVRWRWQVSTLAGQELFASGDFIYQDDRVAWHQQTDEVGRLDIVLASSLRLDPDALVADLTLLLDRLQAETGSSPTARLMLYPPDVPIGCDQDDEGQPVVRYVLRGLDETAPCDLALAQRVIQASGYTPLQVSDPETFVRDLRVAFVRDAYRAAWEGGGVPGWFQEGIIQLYVPPERSSLETIRQRLRTGRPFTLSQMAARPAEQSQAWHEQAYSLVLYLMDVHGVPPVLALARGAGTDFAAAYERAFGAPLSALLPAWQSWLFTNRAAAAYLYDIYQPATPTPLPTATASRTPRPPTAAPSATPTQEQSPTPRPTRTRIPPTATITPLPAQSFVLRSTPTPVPPGAVVAEFAGLTVNQWVIIGLGFVAGLVVIAAGLFWGRRR